MRAIVVAIAGLGSFACSEEPLPDRNDDADEAGLGAVDSGNPGENDPPELSWQATDLELELYEAINDYRAANSLPPIPYSPSLSRVARTHSTDLLQESPHTVGDCNLHSWSDAGPWSSCCYTPDHAEAACMWDKPRELTDYPGNGYEISVFGTTTAQDALDAWKGSAGHNNVILNLEGWVDFPWSAMGVGADGAFINVWFGGESDPLSD